jgi:transketolase
MTTPPGITSLRNPTDLRDPRSFDHVGRDVGASSLVSGEVLAQLARDDERIVCGTADIQFVTHLAEFRLEHPERMFQFGIAERTMVGAAAGMAACGYRPYVSTFACFLGLLAYENIRTDLAYPNLPARLLATHAGISMGFFGTSHHATEDISAMRSIANLTVLSPCDGPSYAALLRATVEHPGPIYFRLGRGRDERVHHGALAGFRPGPPVPVHQGGERLVIVATGATVAPSVQAARALAGELGEEVATVLDAHTLKPFDAETVAAAVGEETRVLVVEEHNVEGGLGTIVREALDERGIHNPLYKHGLHDEYAIVGPPMHLYAYYGLDAAGIAVVARRLLDRREPPAAGERLWTDADRERTLREIQGRRQDRTPPAATKGLAG